MDICKVCHKPNTCWTSFEGQHMCFDCAEKLNLEKVNKAVDAAKEPRDYAKFTADDLADGFWMALGRYVKRPNRKDLKKMKDMFMWACHDSHAQSANFANALKWCNIDLWAEAKKRFA